ncbi:P-loop containing nucleoside triphosphate hydrolase protein [Trametes elegans]|nr:P-loop containing nucleoside triphosphate hydrolase protein [Trametes elegans]
MLRVPQLLLSQCRPSICRPLVSACRVEARYRSVKVAPSRKWRRNDTSNSSPPDRKRPPERKIRVRPDKVREFLASNARTWLDSSYERIFDRLMRFGVPREEVRPLLKTYLKALEQGSEPDAPLEGKNSVFDALNYGEEQLTRIAYDISNTSPSASMDQHYTKILYEWANTPQGKAVLETAVSSEVVSSMQALFRSADLSDLTWKYPFARRSHPRKFIMHVGPTNSGKTHNALRALAAAKRGIYAGPLRLLAYEIWDRLNKGQIVPLGVDPDPAAEPDSQSNIDLGEVADANADSKSVAVTRTGNPKYARRCNMITGEEQKIVEDNAPLLSCTVEMVPVLGVWDVAVVDEIQLIADRARGGAWTAAVLGLDAREIHLCGEESAVPVIEAIARDLGDTVEVKRYNRLTPLVVAEKSLDGNLKNIQKGDCVVSFSRTGIFGLKKRIEKVAKMRCALAYGRLPPEIRSEQAALFNDPDSDYAVLVGSDAIGMGLNLKIKRIVFDSVSKWDGGRSQPLSASQIKQIAGRAGRFGLHGDGDSPGGVVTTLHPNDLEYVRKCLKAPYDVIRYARVQIASPHYRNVVTTLPRGSSQMTVADAFHYISKMQPLFELQNVHELEQCFTFIDTFMDCLTVDGRLLVQNAPCPWRDSRVVAGATALMSIHREDLRVPVEAVLQRSGLLGHLNTTLRLMESDSLDCDQKDLLDMLAQLETIHKVIVFYLWYSYRQPVAFPDQAKAFKLRQLTEIAMDWILEVLHQIRLQSPDPAGVARRDVLRRRPLSQVDKANSTPSNYIKARKAEKAVRLTNAQGRYLTYITR